MISALPEISSLLPSEPCTASSPPTQAQDAEPAAQTLLDDDAVPSPTTTAQTEAEIETGVAQPPLSKNQQKKLRRKQEWEASRDDRRLARKEKDKEKRQRRKDERASALAAGLSSPSASLSKRGGKTGLGGQKVRHVPMTFVVDCAYDALMSEGEVISLGAQIERCYSETRRAPVQPVLAISGFGGRLKEWFEGAAKGQYRNWRRVKVQEDSCVRVAEMAREWMDGIGAVDKATTTTADNGTETPTAAPSQTEPAASLPSTQQPQIIYLTSESPHTLTHLHPHSTYIIGGLVDRNRHKGVCHKTAAAQGIATARLPLAEHLTMSSRKVLTTCHVVEILLRWLEHGDWGRAFVDVLPKRKGGVLRTEGGSERFDAEDEVQGERGTRLAEDEDGHADDGDGAETFLAEDEDKEGAVDNSEKTQDRF
jgi:tRNA (guanine9-N1)-methyltransferase